MCSGLGKFNVRARLVEPRGEPFGDCAAGGGLMIHAEVDKIGILKEKEVPERAGAIVAVDAVGVARRVYLARLFA